MPVIRRCRIACVANSHAYALIGMFTRSLEAWPVSRWDCGLTLSCILGKPDRLLGAADSGTDRRGDRTQISGSERQPTPARPAALGVGHANPADQQLPGAAMGVAVNAATFLEPATARRHTLTHATDSLGNNLWPQIKLLTKSIIGHLLEVSCEQLLVV
jgi:hypothetical protein